MQTDRISPQQEERMERLFARFPSTSFEVVGQDAYSMALVVEWEDLASAGQLAISAAGKVVVL